MKDEDAMGSAMFCLMAVSLICWILSRFMKPASSDTMFKVVGYLWGAWLIGALLVKCSHGIDPGHRPPEW